MAASQIWNVKAPSGTTEGAFKASKALYANSIGLEVGITPIPAAQNKSTPVYAIGELLKVGWLIAINVYLKQSTNKTSVVTVYCSAEKAEAFIAKCRAEPSGLTINGKEVLSAARPRRQSFS
ncbi:hypothetical protein [Microcoleus sp.]|uniref:hypothetical protein n=1 Tax=Microcoleus sp. TaxID=44472 RepID=UPI0035263D36